MSLRVPAPAPVHPANGEPSRDCPLCPRLKEYREVNRASWPDWSNAPVESFGALDARLLIVGLAPGLRGANRTGRPFTGDWAGDLLYATLSEFGFCRGQYASDPADGLSLQDCRITNAVRCVPPQNKPTTPEIRACMPFLTREIAAMENLTLILTLGGIAHGAVVSSFGLRKSAWRFSHGAEAVLPGGPTLISSYHCSRYNTNTKRLTPEMFRDIVRTVRGHLDA